MLSSGLTTFGRRRLESAAVAVAAVFLFSIGATLAAPAARAADPITVSGSGTFSPYVGSPTVESFSVSVTNDGAGTTSGTFSVTNGTTFNATCVSVQGDNAVVTGNNTEALSTLWATLYVHDGGASGDTAHI
ncbi:MAG: hypothetical protein QOD78_2650, partial [Chloroflexota bacterium]|nr:hypothetical protein [Chloroflexota bacterium]